MDKHEAIAILRELVEEAAVKRAGSIAEEIYKNTGLYPEGWAPHKDGLLWQGFYFRRVFGPFEFQDGTVAAAVRYTVTRRRWWGGKYDEVDVRNRRIDGARALLNLLEKEEPYG